MDAATLQYLRKLFRNYYERNAGSLLLPPDFSSREFAAQLWGMKSYIRHLAFKSRQSFEDWVREKAPRHLYYSSAVYVMPGAQNMDEKGWVGADLIFDIDADHLPACQGKIVEIRNEAKGLKTSIAPDECLDAAAWEAVKLVDVLRHELGFSDSSIRVEFSGHRGFHVIVSCKGFEECFTADSTVRKEILDYIRGEMYDASLLEFTPETRGRRRVKIYPIPPRVSDPGLRGRIARIAVLLARREGEEMVIKALSAPPLDASRLYKRHRDVIESYLSKAMEEIRVDVDPQVTLDTKRLIRVPYSLHGKSGLVVKPLDASKLVSSDWNLVMFSPFTRLDSIKVRLLVDVKDVKIFGHKLRLSAGNEYRLPAPIAIYLMSKEIAVLSR